MRLDNSPYLLFCELWILSLRCLRWLSLHVNKEECILLTNMQHSQPHISFYWSEILLSWGGNMLCNIESLMIILYYESFASFCLPDSGGITMLLCSSMPYTWNKNHGTNCSPTWTYIDNLIQSLAIWDCKNWGWYRIHL